MNGIAATFEEATAQERVVSVPLGHLSIEVGHLYAEDFRQGPTRVEQMFRQVAGWVTAAREQCAAALSPQRARISTCFLIDDYFQAFGTPRDVIPMVLRAAEAGGLQVDYVARESACAGTEALPLAALVAGRLVADPPPGSDGSRPATQLSGWLCNGVRSPVQRSQAMRPPPAWSPPAENGANRHSVFLDVELWDDRDGVRTWSCPFLASVWQLWRLGLLRMEGEPVFPAVTAGEFPERWTDLAPLTRINDDADPFAAYRTFTALPNGFLPIEHAVRTILSQVAIEPAIVAEIARRAGTDGVVLPMETVGRLSYAFTAPLWRESTDSVVVGSNSSAASQSAP